MMTRTMASTSVVTISFIPSVIGRVVSIATMYSRPSGNCDFNSSICALTCFATANALEPGAW